MVNRLKIAQEFANAIYSEDIEEIILFGSVARGDDNSDSEIDILIISDNELKIEPKISDEVFNIIKEYRELVSAHVMSKKHFNETKNYPFLKNVIHEGVILA